ncbi:MAG TPA: tripartite tricarboxylate transporter substrate-binding protein [Xanthobacteraceae bacterium]|nr:tripartite tricarboxylate transporter substrate-binding protein [Xanthobacteraceae bacterium]
MEFHRRHFLRLTTIAGAACTLRGRALDYPTRPVRIIVAFAPGGPTDIFGRIAAQKLSEQFGKQFYVENIGGGGGNIGAAQAARAAPDGYTILFTVSALVTNPAFLGKAPYDPIQDFAPVAIPIASAITIVTHPSLGVRTLDELITLVRANPGTYTYASGGAGAQPHLAFEQFRLSLGLDIVHVPFAGAGPAVASIVAGHTPIGVSSLPPCVPHIQEGSLRALVLSSTKRSQKLPDIPTAAEAGHPIFTGDQWLGVLVPAGTPEEIVSLLYHTIVDITVQPDVKERLAALDFYQIQSTPQQFADRIKVELQSWRKVVQAAHINPG